MIDLEQALADQTDLTALCAERTAFHSAEKFVRNETYGFARILKEYAGYPLDRHINAVVPHGVYLNASQMIVEERESGLPAVLNYPAFRADIWRETTDKVVVPSASPVLYAMARMRERYPVGVERNGTIFFPAHTVSHDQTDSEWDEVAEGLLALEERFQPVTVCVYYVDYWKGLHRPFERRGLRLVSAGNHADPQFMYRWLHLASTHRYAASNDVGGALLYASAAGLPTFLTSRLVTHTRHPAMRYMPKVPGHEQAAETKQRIAESFNGNPDEPPEGQREIVDYLLGAENFKPPEGLLADLEYVARL